MTLNNCWLMFVTFFVYFTYQNLIQKNKLLVLLPHIMFCGLFISMLAGAGVQNDSYDRLNTFINLEKISKLNIVKNNPQNYDKMLVIDVNEFSNSTEFKNYIAKYDIFLNKLEFIFLGYLLVITSNFSNLIIKIFKQLISSVRFRLK
jgi:hypothetical protein